MGGTKNPYRTHLSDPVEKFVSAAQREGEFERIRRGDIHKSPAIVFGCANFISAHGFICSSDRAKPSESKDNLNRQRSSSTLEFDFVVEFVRERRFQAGTAPLFARVKQTSVTHISDEYRNR